MKNMMESLFHEHKRKIASTGRIKELEKRVENDRSRLKLHMSKKEKAILLEMIDAKDLIIEATNYHSFVCGFKAGLKIGYEVNRE